MKNKIRCLLVYISILVFYSTISIVYAATEIEVSPTSVNYQPFDFSIIIRDSKGLKNINFDEFTVSINGVESTFDLFSDPNLKIIWNGEKEAIITVPNMIMSDGVHYVNISVKNKRGKIINYDGEISVADTKEGSYLKAKSASDWVKQRAWSMIKQGVAAKIIRAFFEANGYTCYNKPIWVPVPKTYWYGLTCARPVM